MFRIRVERTLAKPVERVFDVLADHERYDRFPGISRSKLVEPGTRDKNGEGAIRRIGAGGVEFWERITELTPPSRIQYRIVRATPIAIDHDLGRIDLEPLAGGGTRVTWISEGRLRVPLIGRFLDRVAQQRGERAFGNLLSFIEKL